MAKANDLATAMDTPATLTIADLVTALQLLKGEDEDTLKRRAEYEAEAHKRINKRENDEHPQISVFSYPEGNLAHPKALLKCKMFWVGFDESEDVLTPQEIELMNLAVPGEYVYSKTDGSTAVLTIAGDYDNRGGLTRLHFRFPCTGENKHNQPGRVPMLREIFGTRIEEDDLRQQLAETRARLEAVLAATS